MIECCATCIYCDEDMKCHVFEPLNVWTKADNYCKKWEADARELRESNSLASNFANMLSRCFQSTEKFDDDVDDVEEGENDALD